jgi:phospholipid/cholesterol/gamma-HCH transport system ATP-binding protein
VDANEILRLENVSLSKNGKEVLRDVSFTLAHGENTVFFGPEDSGIGALCPLIAGLESEFEGEVIFKGTAIHTFDYIRRHNYRKEIGYLQMGYGLINNMSVEENIALPLRYHSNLSTEGVQSVVTEFVERLHLQDCRKKRPVDLSAGEVLRTAFCRSVALDPELLLIEHPLEGQCLLNSQLFINRLWHWSRRPNKSTIMVTYEPERFVDFCTRFIMLHEGRIVFAGNRDDFLAQDNEYLLQYRISSVDGPMRV